MATSPMDIKTADLSLVADPLSKLHKMSTTAGVASHQYVAVNIAAVMAPLLGVASGLSIFSPLLLLIPIVGIIVALSAWRQINNSNGTETGKPLAVIGLLLSLILGGGVLGKEVVDHAKARSDARLMETLVAQLNDAVKAGKYDAAHQLFDIEFRTRVPVESFRTQWELMQRPEAYGRLKSMTWNEVLPQYEKIEGDTSLAGVIFVLVKFDRSEGRFTFVYRKAGDGWQITGLPEMFPTERASKK